MDSIEADTSSDGNVMVDEWLECWDGVVFGLFWADSPEVLGSDGLVKARVAGSGDGAEDLAYLDKVDSARETGVTGSGN